MTLDLDNRCALDPTDSLEVLAPDNSYFSYPFSSVCEGGPTLKIDSITKPGGMFTAPPSIAFADSSGTIDLHNSIPGGPNPITYTTNGDCPTTSQRLLTIFPKPVGGSLESHPGGPVCSGEQVSLRAVAAGATGYDFYLNGDSVAGLFDLYQSDSLQDGDTILCVLSNSAGCTDTLTTMANIAPVPHSVILERPRTLARLDPLRVKVVAPVQNTVYRWEASPIGPPAPSGVEVYQDEGETVTLDQGEEISFEIGFRLLKSTDPGTIQIVLRPIAGSCEGEADTLLVEILPSVEAIFVPEVLTPDGNGLNDTWIVTWLPEIDPDLYELRLYNRAGGEVARIHPLHPDWNGENLPDGVYWWALHEYRGPAIQSGGLTIRRK